MIVDLEASVKSLLLSSNLRLAKIGKGATRESPLQLTQPFQFRSGTSEQTE